MISPPEIKPKLPLDDKTPEMTQTRSPLLYGSVVPGSGFSSFHFPENEHTATPANMRIKETLVTAIRQGEKLWEWRKSKGMTVPTKAPKPAITANPRDMPTAAIPKPNVTALTPQPMPNTATASKGPMLVASKAPKG